MTGRLPRVWYLGSEALKASLLERMEGQLGNTVPADESMPPAARARAEIGLKIG